MSRDTKKGGKSSVSATLRLHPPHIGGGLGGGGCFFASFFAPKKVRNIRQGLRGCKQRRSSVCYEVWKWNGLVPEIGK